MLSKGTIGRKGLFSRSRGIFRRKRSVERARWYPAAGVALAAGVAALVEVLVAWRWPWLGVTTGVLLASVACGAIGRALGRASLRAANGRLEAILAGIGDWCLMLDHNYRVTAVNGDAAALFGQANKTLLGRLFWDVMPIDGSEFLRALYVSARTGSKPVEVVTEWGRGSGRWVHHHVQPGCGNHELMVLLRDVSSDQVAKAAARDTQALLQSTLDSLSTQIAILDRGGNVVAANAAWRRFGAARPESDRHCAVGMNYFDYWEKACESSTHAIAVLSGLLSVLKGERREFRHEYPFGDEADAGWFQLRVSRFGRDDAVKLVVAHEDVSEVKRSEERLRLLTRRTVRVQDEERRHIARELHDSTAQNLLGATLGIFRAKRLVPTLPAEAEKALADACNLIEQSQREIRTTAYLLHPPMLDEAGLPTALKWYLDGFIKRSGITVDLTIAPALEDERLPYNVETALFRVLQEALANVHRHSGSDVARVTLDRPAEHGGACVVLTVEDDGRGMTGTNDDGRVEFWRDTGPFRGRGGIGLVGMSERIRQLDGYLRVHSRPGRTTVSAVIRLESGGSQPASTA